MRNYNKIKSCALHLIKQQINETNYVIVDMHMHAMTIEFGRFVGGLGVTERGRGRI